MTAHRVDITVFCEHDITVFCEYIWCPPATTQSNGANNRYTFAMAKKFITTRKFKPSKLCGSFLKRNPSTGVAPQNKPTTRSASRNFNFARLLRIESLADQTQWSHTILSKNVNIRGKEHVLVRWDRIVCPDTKANQAFLQTSANGTKRVQTMSNGDLLVSWYLEHIPVTQYKTMVI